jgi:hypothetical protein
MKKKALNFYFKLLPKTNDELMKTCFLFVSTNSNKNESLDQLSEIFIIKSADHFDHGDVFQLFFLFS